MLGINEKTCRNPALSRDLRLRAKKLHCRNRTQDLAPRPLGPRALGLASDP